MTHSCVRHESDMYKALIMTYSYIYEIRQGRLLLEQRRILGGIQFKRFMTVIIVETNQWVGVCFLQPCSSTQGCSLAIGVPTIVKLSVQKRTDYAHPP